MFDFANPIYQNADAAREHLESIQWPHGPVCPHCGNVDAARITKLAGKTIVDADLGPAELRGRRYRQIARRSGLGRGLSHSRSGDGGARPCRGCGNPCVPAAPV